MPRHVFDGGKLLWRLGRFAPGLSVILVHTLLDRGGDGAKQARPLLGTHPLLRMLCVVAPRARGRQRRAYKLLSCLGRGSAHIVAMGNSLASLAQDGTPQ